MHKHFIIKLITIVIHDILSMNPYERLRKINTRPTRTSQNDSTYIFRNYRYLKNIEYST